MTVPQKDVRWRKSTRSETGDCVELGHTGDVLRDSKNATGPTLRVDLRSLVSAVKTDIVR